MMACTTHPSIHLVSQAAAARRARFWIRFLTALLRALSVAPA
jgi:hypothetical protein